MLQRRSTPPTPFLSLNRQRSPGIPIPFFVSKPNNHSVTNIKRAQKNKMTTDAASVPVGRNDVENAVSFGNGMDLDMLSF